MGVSAFAVPDDSVSSIGSAWTRITGEGCRAGGSGNPAVGPVNPKPPVALPVRSGGELRIRRESFDRLLVPDDEGKDLR